jgi:hypothetical protein
MGANHGVGNDGSRFEVSETFATRWNDREICREPEKLRWITWDAGLTTVAWFLTSLVFSFYLDHFANYNATYGTLGTLIGFMAWIWISVVLLILGAEVDAELEHQTAKDTPTGEPLPIGTRVLSLLIPLDGRSIDRNYTKKVTGSKETEQEPQEKLYLVVLVPRPKAARSIP